MKTLKGVEFIYGAAYSEKVCGRDGLWALMEALEDLGIDNQAVLVRDRIGDGDMVILRKAFGIVDHDDKAISINDITTQDMCGVIARMVAARTLATTRADSAGVVRKLQTPDAGLFLVAPGCAESVSNVLMCGLATYMSEGEA